MIYRLFLPLTLLAVFSVFHTPGIAATVTTLVPAGQTTTSAETDGTSTVAAAATTTQTFEVGPGKPYANIGDALAAATDPNVDKFIVLGPHTYEYPMNRNSRIQLTVPRTHLKGEGPAKTRIIARSGKGKNSWGVLEVRASDCSVDGIWIENRWQKGDPPNKQSALTVGTAEDPADEPDGKSSISGIRISRCKMTGTTNDRHSKDMAWDVVTVGANVTGCIFENCEMRGFADVFSSWAQRVDVKNCVIDAIGWNAIWVAGGDVTFGYPQESVAVFENCQLGSSHYYVAGGSGVRNLAVPVVYLKDCSPYPATAAAVEVARMQDLSHALAIVVRNTPFVPYLAVKGGPKGNPPTLVMPDVLFKPELLKLFNSR